jgi:hypothetical protein
MKKVEKELKRLQEALAPSIEHLKLIILELIIFCLFLYELWRFLQGVFH